MHTQTVLAFCAYFFILLCIGLYFHKKQTTSVQFILGNRSLSFWLVALSAHASDMSAWLFIAFPESVFNKGLSQIWIAMGLLMGMFLNWQLVAPRLRIMTEKYNCDTLSSFFEKRLHDTSGIIRKTSAIVMIIFLTHYLSAGLIGMGILLENLFDINYYIGLTFALLIVVLYTFLGGFATVAWVDLFQALFLLAVIVFVPWIAFQHVGGWSEIFSIAKQKKISLEIMPLNQLGDIFIMFDLALGWGLGYFGMPHVITKFMGIKDVKEMNKSKWVGMSWQLVALTAAAFVGVVAIAFFPENLANSELVFVEMVKQLFNPFVTGFILCAVIAANMSTMDSQILVCASTMSEDLYKPFHKIPPSDKSVLWFSKLSVIGISIFALFLAFNRSATILETVLYSWSGLGSAFGPLVLMSLYSKKINKNGGLAGIIVGTAVVMIWPSVNDFFFPIKISPMIPGFTLSSLAIYLVSTMTQQKKEDHSLEHV